MKFICDDCCVEYQVEHNGVLAVSMDANNLPLECRWVDRLWCPSCTSTGYHYDYVGMTAAVGLENTKKVIAEAVAAGRPAVPFWLNKRERQQAYDNHNPQGWTLCEWLARRFDTAAQGSPATAGPQGV